MSEQDDYDRQLAGHIRDGSWERPMTPPPVTEADRQRAADLLRERIHPVGCPPDCLQLLLAQGLAAQREEHCRAVCGYCAHSEGWGVAMQTDRLMWNHGSQYCKASPIRSLPPQPIAAEQAGWCDVCSPRKCIHGPSYFAAEQAKPEPPVYGIVEAARDVEKRLREDTVPLVALINEHGDAAAKRAWKWAIYGSAVHLQAFLPRVGETSKETR